MRKQLLLGTIVSMIGVACMHEPYIDPNAPVNPPVIVTNPPSNSDTVCFNSEILPLYTTYCGSSGCHSAASHRSGVDVSSYAAIMQGIRASRPSSSNYYTIIGNGMPPRSSPQLSSTQIALISIWISQGALNTNCINSCDTSKFTYTNPIQTLINNNCIGCHGTKPGSGNVYLGDYASTKAYITANQTLFLNAINHSASLTAAQRMPPANKMADCQIAQFNKWITKGFPQ